MELKDFISQTLREIAEGVYEGAKGAEQFDAVVNPREQAFEADLTYGKEVNVEFTIGLSVTDATTAKAGIGVVAGIFAIGSQGESNASHGSTTHVKFSVPIILPSPVARKPQH